MIGGKTKKDKAVAFFDIGHDVLRMALVSSGGHELSAFQTKCLGFSKGKVVDASLFAASIGELLSSAGVAGSEIYAILSIPTLQTRTLRRSIQHKCGGSYRSSDYASLEEAAIDSATSDLDEVIDVYVAHCWLDDKAIDSMSFGQSGRGLRAQVLLATHPKILLADILSAMNFCGIEVSEFRSGYFGLARALTSLRPGVENAVLIDIGHSTTSGVITIGGSVQQVFNVPAGSNHITRDLMVALNESYDHAELFKVTHGLTSNPSGIDLGKFIRPRVAEILALSLKNYAIYAKALDGGLMFCGNGSQLSGFAPFAGRALGTVTPFICSLSGKTAASFIDVTTIKGSAIIDSGWMILFSQIKTYLEDQAVRRFERDARPLAKLRPLWTWLSELSR